MRLRSNRSFICLVAATNSAWLAEAGISLIFSWQGAVVAATVVVFPLIYKSARAALEQVDGRLEDAARTLGAGEWRICLTISLPLAWRGIFAGIMLAFARGMGEFGATLMLAGNIPGRTQTLALAIYDAFQAGNDARATLLVLVTSALCMGLLAGAELLVRLRRRTRATRAARPQRRLTGRLLRQEACAAGEGGLPQRRPAC